MLTSSIMLKHEIETRFSAIEAAKTNHLQEYFNQLRNGLKVFRGDPYALEALLDIYEVFEKNGNSVNSEA